MLIIPAIDLLQGKAVRLSKGQRDQATVYSDDPLALIEGFVKEGAARVHVVDLDGAFAGSRKHSEVMAKLCERSPVPVQMGGGIRNRETLDQCFKEGASFVVLGTAAIKTPTFVSLACSDNPGKVIVAVDAKNGMVAVEGWVETSEISAKELAKRAAGWGAAALLYTDVDRDGMHTGPNLEATRTLAEACTIPVIASGGITSLDDIRRLKDAGIQMAIVGRALYDKHFTLSEAVAAANS
jgi:phosphoribosylformimino-5-aminoimidazole carboxamide ribotide isomerase